MSERRCDAPGCPDAGAYDTQHGWLCYRHALKAAMDTTADERGELW